MSYTFFLDKVQLPITPPKLDLKISNQNKTINLINEGEVNILKAAGLSEFSFEARIPQSKYPFAIYPDGFKTAEFYLDKFEQLKTGKKPFRFIVSRVSPDGKLLFDSNMEVSLEEYSVSEDAENGLDLIVSINLKQYRTFGKKEVKIVKETPEKTVATSTETRPATTAPAPKTYTVVKGDCLWNIAKKQHGNGSRYTEIAALNGIKNPNLIYAGQVLKLP